MAIYEYVCRTCGARFEVFQSMRSDPLERCGEHCVADPPRGDGEVERQLSVAHVARGSSQGGGGDDFPTCGTCGRTGPDVCG